MMTEPLPTVGLTAEVSRPRPSHPTAFLLFPYGRRPPVGPAKRLPGPELLEVA